MAEGVLRHYGAGRIEVESAGTRPSAVNPTAIQVMKEIGIDISGHQSKHVDELKGRSFDTVITVCDNARESCPAYFGTAEKLHWPFPDPPHDRVVTPEVITRFREVRDLIHARFKAFAESVL
jgi:arsenate reductase